MPPPPRLIKLRVSLDLSIRRSVKFAETEGDEDNSSGCLARKDGERERKRGRDARITRHRASNEREERSREQMHPAAHHSRDRWIIDRSWGRGRLHRGAMQRSTRASPIIGRAEGRARVLCVIKRR